MGILEVKHGRRNYVVQLERHMHGKIELPVQKLGAIFLEGADIPKEPEDVAHSLSALWLWPGKNQILLDAKKTGTEIWLGDLNTSETEDNRFESTIIGGTAVSLLGAGAAAARLLDRRQFLKALGILGATVAVNPIPHYAILEHPGDVKNRKVSRALAAMYGKPFSVIGLRNRVMAHQIKKLAEISGHTNIGVLVGAGHTGITDLLEKGHELTKEEKIKIRKREAEAGAMFRCVYDKTKSRWKVQKYQL